MAPRANPTTADPQDPDWAALRWRWQAVALRREALAFATRPRLTEGELAQGYAGPPVCPCIITLLLTTTRPNHDHNPADTRRV